MRNTIAEIPREIIEYLSYNESTGDLTWIKSPARKTKIGDIAGSINNKTGYIQVQFKGKMYKAHRIIWFIKTGKQPVNLIDHKNNCKIDNYWYNLR